MLVSLAAVLTKAQKGKYAVGAFNISDLEQVEAVVAAATKLKSPVIVNTSEKALAYAGATTLRDLIISLAKQAPVPVVLNLDHGRELKIVRWCIRSGWTGVMFDGSTLDYEQNVRRTAAVKKYARHYRVSIEGEIGQIKYRQELSADSKLVLATPEQARDYVTRTKVDALAVGIGNNHGLPIPGEHLHFTLLKRIQQAVRVPLVLHGASGTPPASIRRAVSLGICKINIDTDLRLAFTGSVRRHLINSQDIDPRSFLSPARDDLEKVVMKKIMLFGSKGKAL